MAKWTKNTFIKKTKNNCLSHVSMIMMDLIKFSEDNADQVVWGSGDHYGTMTFKCKSIDHGFIPLFYITTQGRIKISINLLRAKVSQPEIIRDFQLKLESNFLMDFDSEDYPSDIYHSLEDLFTMRSEVNRFTTTIQSVSARLHQ
tara:strand:+ start:3700 stop:4134 length:435 start_codon:yes stop_codon:yes gene_type:complete